MASLDREMATAPPDLAELRQLGWRRLFGYLRPYRWQMAAAIVGLLVASAIGLADQTRNVPVVAHPPEQGRCTLNGGRFRNLKK